MPKKFSSARQRSGSWRLKIILATIFIIAGGILARLFLIQIFQGGFYNSLAQNQQQVFENLVPQRGEIFIQDRYKDNSADGNQNYFVVATNRTYQMLYAVPKDISEKERAIKELSAILGQPEEQLASKINKSDDPYEPLAHKLDDEQAKKIKNLKIKGLQLAPETWRYYPAGNFMSNVLGFVGVGEDGSQKIGQYGLEEYYQKDLVGESGFMEAVKDAIGRMVFSGDYDLEPAKNGDSLILTIDQNIQFMAEKELGGVIEKWSAASGETIVMEPKTGRILAMANFPNFDPNEYFRIEDTAIFMNASVQEVYEPGSVMKPITMSAGLDSGKIEPQTTYTDSGILKIGGYTVTNAAGRTYGTCTMTKVLEKSINTGAVFVEREVGPDVFREYIEKFGFMEKTGIDIKGEIVGNTSGLKQGSPEINFATASFGQGISVTPVALVSALSAIANGGKLMKPYLVEKIISSDGNETQIEPEMKRQVMSPQAADKLTSMLVSTVKNGYDKIKLKGYYVAGKTGTAEIPNLKTGGYDTGEFIHTFVGWAPAFDPKFIILLKMDKPHGINFASDSLSPPFSSLAQYILNYYQIPPEE
jgi:cell division protein FtsI (penicillin-binding protein 3)/stage V sporulation protein D (sporulation-specific penicillin-binding protein)